jgi:phthiocerol/phenolphthiocerol synthesis type-I polyketide synthase E
MNHEMKLPARSGMEVAVVGLSGRFPGAVDMESFWENIKNGTESVSFFTDDELREAGIDQETLADRQYVKANGAIFHTEWFDTHLFNYSPREAELMDPQLKILHECAWEALENSGYDSDSLDGLVGTYIGCSTNLYWMDTVYRHASDFLKEAELLNGSQFFSTRLSHKLNLTGPSYTVQTACSSSLVAVHLACQALLSGDCDMALAGGVSLTLPEKRGYVYQEGMILSPDGHCRPFDEKAEGTVNGNGAGIVVLKRLEDALADGDTLYAIVKGSAINNDGSDKVSFTAPSVVGQAGVIQSAHHIAEVDPESITYVEAHGTGTKLGDPIEIEALKLAFNTNKKNFCGVGSVKGNIGHLDNAAGVAGFIKTVLALKHRLLPPSINFETPNKKIDFANSPFYVNDRLTSWTANTIPLRAGVSSFGIGGTNAHVVLEEAPTHTVSAHGRNAHLLFLSAQTSHSLEQMTDRLVAYMDQHPDVSLADLSYTLLTGRKKLHYRRMVVVSTIHEAKQELALRKAGTVQDGRSGDFNRAVIFLFPGQGSQYAGMGQELYLQEVAFRDEVDRCCHFIEKRFGYDLREMMYSSDRADTIHETIVTQPAIFVFEYALAKTLMKWGIRPDGMIGHSIGEYVAACLSGVIDWEDALTLVVLRATLMQRLPPGKMLGVLAAEGRIQPLLNSEVSVAAVNGPALTTLSGSQEAITHMEARLDREGLPYKRLKTSHAFHSKMMNPILDDFAEAIKKIKRKTPNIPYISNVTGKWITEKEATDASYWVKHLRNPVQFSAGVETLLAKGEHIFVEVGAGRTLSTLVRQHLKTESANVIVQTVRSHNEEASDARYLLQSIGKLLLHGVGVDGAAYFAHEKRRRIPLPTYAFDRRPYRLRIGENQPAQMQEIDQRNDQHEWTGGSRREIRADQSENSKERKIIDVFREVTGVAAHRSVTDDFFEMGGNSLSAVNAVARLQKEFHLSISQLLEYPRASDLAQHISYKNEENRVSKDKLKAYLLTMKERHRHREEINGRLEGLRLSYQEKNRRYHERDLSGTVNYSDILLTGSTGYLGIYLLRDLLVNTASNVHLVIRSRDRHDAEERILQTITFTFGKPFYEAYRHRLFLYSGDLVNQRLGLEWNDYQTLSETVQCVLHSAANVSHYGKVADLYEANVVCTEHLIQFAQHGIRKDVNHISTMAVASGSITGMSDCLYTEYDHDLGQRIVHPYPRTKLEAEKRMIQARKEGLNVNIFRVGNIVCDSTSGKFQQNIEQNALYSLMRSYIRMGMIPVMDRDTDFSCIDDVSRSIIHLFNRVELNNETHHIYNPNLVSLSDFLTIPGLNLGVKETTLEHFLDYADSHREDHRMGSELYNIQLHSIGDDLSQLERVDDDYTVFHVTSDKTTMLLRRMGFVWNPIDQPLAEKWIAYCRKVNFF